MCTSQCVLKWLVWVMGLPKAKTPHCFLSDAPFGLHLSNFSTAMSWWADTVAYASLSLRLSNFRTATLVDRH